MEDILQEVRNLTANGYKEIVLTGIHISSYGLDFEHTADEQEDYGPFKNSALIDLIEVLSGIEGQKNSPWFTGAKDHYREFCQTPLQSASDLSAFSFVIAERL